MKTIQDRIYALMVEFQKVNGRTPFILRMPPKLFEEFVAESNEALSQFLPLTEDKWRECLESIAGHYRNTSVASFKEMKILEFEPRAFYNGMLVGVSDQYDRMAVAGRVSVEMDNEMAGVVYETAPCGS